MKRIVIIGGNAAGPGAAAKARRVDPNAEITLFEKGNFISTGTCELPYILSGEIKDYKDVVFYTPESFYEEKKVKVYTKHFVEQIDRRNKRISVKNRETDSSFEFNYDKLVIASGSTAKQHPAFVKNYNNVFYLKSVDDYLRIKNYLDNNTVNNVLIIGAGYIGIETAEAFKILGKQVTVIDKAAHPFPGMDSEIKALTAEILSANGIEFKGGISELAVFENNGTVTKVKYDSVAYEYDLVLIAAGFSPNSQLAAGARLEIGRWGGIKVDSKLRTNDQDIYAAGDCIEVQNFITGKYEFMPFATLAHAYGHTAGANAAGDNLFISPVIRNTAVKIFDKVLVSVGLTSAEAESMAFRFSAVTAVMPNLVKVMPTSSKIFGKIIFDKGSRRILGAQFLGGSEAVGYGDLISSLIYQKADGNVLSRFNYNYTPPSSPFVNILSVLGRKIEGVK